MKKLLKRSATTLIIAGATVLFSQSALACDPAQGSGQCTWDGIHHGNNPFPVNNGGYGGYSNNNATVYSTQPTTKTECKMLNNGYQFCRHYSLSTGMLDFEEIINPKTSRPISQIFYHYNGQVRSESSFDEQGERHGIQKHYNHTGQRYAVVVYEHGKEISGEYDDNNGTITKVTQQYTPSHTIENRRIFVNGKQHGLETKQFFHKKKKKWVMLYEVNWVNNKKHGSEKFYSLVNDKGKTKLDKSIEWHNGVQVR